MPDIVTLAGSPSETSRSAALLEYTRRVCEDHGLAVEAIRVRQLPAEDLLFGRSDSPAIQERIALIAAARGLIVATPIYKAAYTGVLKAFFDLLPANILAGKVVLPLATGGAPNHMLAIDYALNPVLAALGATHLINGVYVIDSQVQWSPGAPIHLEEPVATRLNTALQQLITVVRSR